MEAVEKAALALLDGHRSPFRVLEMSAAECRFVRTLAFFDERDASDKLICGDYFENIKPGTEMSAEEYYLARKAHGSYGIKNGIDQSWHSLSEDRFDATHTAWRKDPSPPFEAERSLAKLTFLSVNSQDLQTSTATLRGQLDLVIMNKGLCHCSPALSIQKAPLTCGGVCAFRRETAIGFFQEVIDLLAPEGVAFFHQEHQFLPPIVLSAAENAAAVAMPQCVHFRYRVLGEWSAIFLIKSSSESCSAG